MHLRERLLLRVGRYSCLHRRFGARFRGGLATAKVVVKPFGTRRSIRSVVLRRIALRMAMDSRILVRYKRADHLSLCGANSGPRHGRQC